MTSYCADIVLLENRQSGLALEHYNRKDVEAFAVRANAPNFRWRRLPLATGYCVYQNVGTGCLLDHYVGKPMRACDRDAYNEHCQWLELDVGVSGFVALQNRATGMVLDHYRELLVQADSEHEDGRPSQHWRLVSVRPTQRYEPQDCRAVAAFDENHKYDIVVFRNCETGKVLDHAADAAGDRIEGKRCVSEAVVSKSCQWYRIPICDHTYAYKNVHSGRVLEHCEEDDGSETTVQALTAITHLASHQWQEVDVGGEGEEDSGFIALRNRRTGRKLHHCHETPTHTCEHVGKGGWGSDPKFHWKLVWVRRHPKDPIVDYNRASPWTIAWVKNNVRVLTRSDVEAAS